MTKEELYDLLAPGFSEGYAETWGGFILENGLIEEAMEIALMHKNPQPFRAAYSLEWAFFHDSKAFSPYYERFMSDFNVITSESVMRHYGKIVAWLLKNKKTALSQQEADKIAETAAIRLIDDSIRDGVRVWSLDILHILLPRVEWLRSEMPGIIERLTVNPSPAMAARLRKYPRNSW